MSSHADALVRVSERLARDGDGQLARLGRAVRRMLEDGTVEDVLASYAEGRWWIGPAWWAAAGVDADTRSSFVSAVQAQVFGLN